VISHLHPTSASGKFSKANPGANEAKKDIDKLDGSIRKILLKQFIKLQENPIPA
jgi:hypothetical protein